MAEVIRILQGPKFTEPSKYISRQGKEHHEQYEIPEIIKRTRSFLMTCGNFIRPEEINFKVKVISQSLQYVIDFAPTRIKALCRSLYNSFPEIEIKIFNESVDSFKEETKIRGNPDFRNFHGEKETFLDKLLRSIPPFDFEIIFSLKGKKSAYSMDLINYFEDAIKRISPRTSRQTSFKGPLSPSRTRTEINQEADFAVEFFKTHLLRMEEGFATGLWDTTIKIRADKKEEIDRIVKSITPIIAPFDEFLYPVSYTSIDPLERINNGDNLPSIVGEDVTLKNRKSIYKQYLGNVSTSTEIASLLAFPQNEIPGFKVKKYVTFGGTVPEKKGEITLGNLILSSPTNPTNIELKINSNDLVKHVLIAGVTGIGKTVTAKHILCQLDKKGIPFLVMEPTKVEYSALEDILGHDKIKIFTVGNENKKPIRINPFEFPSELSVQTHIDLLKSVFNASFPMYGPMPYILERAINNAYKKMGWDLKSGKNLYVESEQISEKYKCLPRLEDLYNEIESVMKEIEYSKDLTSDVKGALRVRIGSLMTGAKGYMFNVDQTEPSIEELLKSPAILELQFLGDDDEKVFFMGLILMRIYEYYLSKNEFPGDKLLHVTLIEEAHRLLRNVPGNVSMEVANVKGKALETFNNILAEVRAYGEGMMIADQIPSKLSPDTLKNTSIKIVHRLYSRDDREIVGDSIGLNDDQKEELIHLKIGQAVVFHEDLNTPVKVEIKADKKITKSIAPPHFPKSVIDITDPYISSLEENLDFKKLVWSLLNTLIIKDYEENQDFLKDLRGKVVKELNEIFNEFFTKLGTKKLQNVLEEASQRVTKQYINQIGEDNKIRFIKKLKLEKATQECAKRIVKVQEDMGDTETQCWKELREEYINIFKSKKPYKACRECKNPCLYKPLLTVVLMQNNYEKELAYEVKKKVDQGEILGETVLLNSFTNALRDRDIYLFTDLVPIDTLSEFTFCILANLLQNDEDTMDKVIGIEEPFSNSSSIQNLEKKETKELLPQSLDTNQLTENLGDIAESLREMNKKMIDKNEDLIKELKEEVKKGGIISSGILGGGIAGCILGGGMGAAIGMIINESVGLCVGLLIGIISGIIGGATGGGISARRINRILQK